MDAFSQSPPSPGQQSADPRLQPTPDYGTLGPGSDVKVAAGDATVSRPAARPVRRGPFIAIALGASLAALIAGAGKARPSLPRITDLFSFANPPVASAAKDLRELDRMRPEKQAEVL